MKITTVTVSYARTFSLENHGGPKYESIKPETSITAELDENDDPEQALAQLREMAKQSVKDQAQPILDHYRKRVDEVRSNLPADVQEQLED